MIMNTGEYVIWNGIGQSVLIPAGFISWIIIRRFYAAINNKEFVLRKRDI